MTTDVDWQELIDGSFGDGPGHRPVEQRLVAGRRALRRRRIVVGAAAVVLTVAAGGVALAAASSVPSSESPVVENPQRDEQQLVLARDAVIWKDSGWWIAPGWTVEKRIQNPMDYKPPKQSVAFDLINPPYHRLVLAVYDGDGGTTVNSAPSTAGSLESWLPGAVVNQRNLDGEPQPDLVHFGTDETLVAGEGVTILDQVPHPDLPANFAPEQDRTAAAWIDDQGREKFVLVREAGGEEQVIPFTGRFNSLNDFLRFAVQQYDSGEGLL